MVFAFRGTHTPAAWEDWREWGGDNYDVTDDGVTLSGGLTPTYVDPEPVTTPSGRPADVALDECGTLYVLTRDGDVYRDDREDGVLEPVPWQLFEDADGGAGGGGGSSGEGGSGAGDGSGSGGSAPPAPAGLALASETMYVLDGTGRLHDVSRDFWTTRRVFDAFEGPVAVVADESRAYVLEDRADGSAVVAVDADGGTETVVSTTDLTAPLDLALDADGNLYVLATAPGSGRIVQRFDRAGAVGGSFTPAPEPVRVPDHFDAACIAVVGVDEVVVGVGSGSTGRLTLVRYLPDRGTFERVSTFEGASETLLLRRVAHGHERGLYVLDPHGVLTFLVEARTNRLSRTTGGYDARVVRRFDAGLPDVEWHRMTLDFTPAGPGTGVRLSYAATDDVGVEEIDWVPLGRSDPHDGLLTDARGRYLWVELTVVGTESASPALHAFRAYFPRSSYLRYLPAIYGEDEESAAFLERFLSVFESLYLGIEERIDSLPRFLDARGIDAEFLGWLESWLALAPEETWREEDRRALLEAAPALYRGRGTRAGLIALIRLFLAAVEPPAVPWEAARERERVTVEGLVADGYLTETEGEDLLDAHEALAAGPTSDLLYLVESRDLDCIDDPEALAPYRRLVPCPHCFVVLLAPYVDRERRRTVERIVGTERPAHAVGRVVGLQPWVELGGHAYLGVNSTLPTRELVLERSGLGRDSVLAGPGSAPLPAGPCEEEGTSGGANGGTNGEASADD